MCTSVAGCFFGGFFLGQKDGENFFGIFFDFQFLAAVCLLLTLGIFYEIPQRPSTNEGDQRSRSDAYIDGLLDRASANYKWPAELGKCSKGSLGHPEALHSGNLT